MTEGIAIGGTTVIKKIDDEATEGLSGTPNSLAYRVEEIEKHFHNREKWLGIAAVADAELHVADRMVGTTAPFVLTAGNNDFGAWVQMLGSTDTPVSSGMTKFDIHRFIVTDTNSVLPFIIQVVGGESADIAAKLAAEEFTEAPYKASSNSIDTGIEDMMSNRLPVGTKGWARCACIGGNGTTLSVYAGIHEYVG